MGLDMYLEGRRYLWTYPDDGPEAQKSKAIAEMFPEIGNSRVKQVTTELGYWRKANAIHKWFVKNVQDGEDNCKPYYVELEQLEKLLEAVNAVLADTSKAHEILPTTSGFFFGNTDYNEWYFRDLEDTKEIIEKILGNRERMKAWDIYYQASW